MTIDVPPVAVVALEATLSTPLRHDLAHRDALIAEGYQYARGEMTTLASPDVVCALVDEIEQMKAAFGMLNAHLCDVRRKVAGR
jgi:hypothetical protein